MKEALTLYELNTKIKQIIDGKFYFPVWVVAEISELNERNHCYLELIEKDNDADVIIAKNRAIVWAHTYNMLKPYFETTTGYELTAGLRVLLNVEIRHSEIYGLSLYVKDIDPSYTLGDVERRRREIINRLKEDGVFGMNKLLALPSIPKTIAVISSKQAAGYQDFIKQLEQNAKGYIFQTKLFHSIMQGDQAVSSIMKSLEKIYEYDNVFDAVVMIRGGGAKADLACFDNYELASHIAQFPLPVLIGIGHDKDTSIADEVAHTSLKTPTALATFLIQCFKDVEEDIINTYTYFLAVINNYFSSEKLLMEQYYGELKYLSMQKLKELAVNHKDIKSYLQKITQHIISVNKEKRVLAQQRFYYLLNRTQQIENERIGRFSKRIEYCAYKFIERQKSQLRYCKSLAGVLSPKALLGRGYSITFSNGKIIKDSAQLSSGDLLETHLSKGVVKSEVKRG